MTNQRKLIILACGSFNPLTNMHLRMFEIARNHMTQKGEYEAIGGIISPVNDHYATSKFLAPAHHRCRMVELALKPLLGASHWVRLDTWECKQERWMKTLEVLRYHQQQNNQDPTKIVSIKLLCGSDMFDSFNVPNLWRDEDIEEIVRQFGIIVIARHGSDAWKTLQESCKSNILLRYQSNIEIIEEKVVNTISSTFIRQAIEKGQSIRYLVEDSIIEYIEEHKLYK